MKPVLLLCTTLLAISSCINYELRERKAVLEVMRTLPGTWQVTEVAITAKGDFYTRRAGILRDTVIRDFGQMTFSSFYNDLSLGTEGVGVNSSDIVFEYDGHVLDAKMEKVFLAGKDDLIAYPRISFPRNADWDSSFGRFIDDIFFLNGNFRLKIINRNHVELEALTRSVARIVLER